MRIGFIGLGIMGRRMARNLLADGHALQVYNRTREKADALTAAGAAWAETPALAVRDVEVLVTMLATPVAVQTLALEDDGFLAAMPRGSRWVDCSTVHPGFVRWMAGLAGAQGVHLIDAPVAGTKGPAAAGELVFLAGGRKDDIDFCRPLFDSMGKKVLQLGGVGQGAAMKMVFNLMLGSAMAAYAEALVLGDALGLPREKLADVLLEAPVSAPFLKAKQALIDQDDFGAHFPLRWMRKDLHLAAQSAYEQGAALPTLNAIKEVYALAEKAGWGKQDFAAVWKFLAG
ncbi:MAG: NAD(P)-dependent oxidoreductase [Desulfobacterales bacterium]|nr:NAD(P)-dependent oxidoreductase [Desulfobacterales bacterium]